MQILIDGSNKKKNQLNKGVTSMSRTTTTEPSQPDETRDAAYDLAKLLVDEYDLQMRQPNREIRGVRSRFTALEHFSQSAPICVN